MSKRKHRRFTLYFLDVDADKIKRTAWAAGRQSPTEWISDVILSQARAMAK